MHKHKKAIIGVVFILVFAISFITIPQAFAVDADCGGVTEEDAREKYGLYVEKAGSNNKYEVIMDAAVAGDKKASDFNKAKFKIVEINGVPVEMDNVLSSANNSVVFTGDTIVEGTKHYTTVKLERLELPETPPATGECVLMVQYINLEYAYTVENGKYIEVAKVPNEHYYGKCAEFRNDGIAQGATDFYQKYLPYCYQATVTQNYTESKLISTIATVKQLWNNKVSGAASSATFNEIYVNVPAANKYDKNTSLPSSIKLKCDYAKDSLKTAEGVITDYYANKDYYYKESVEPIGDKISYTYHYAPGRTEKTPEKDSCIRTCKEAVKVEYGPPVASKAGLCFEYKVKVTSSVFCETELNIEPPEDKTGSFCNPAPACREYYGNVFNKFQAGPTEDFDQCIKDCDGGKYTQKCSIKCYKKIYGQDITKLALNYENYQSAKLAAYSSELQKCLEDNKNHQGCYVVDGGQIKWYSYATYKEGEHVWNDVSRLGRWYILNDHLNRYSAEQIKEKLRQGTFVVDKNGFFRQDFGESLCTDVCKWNALSCPTNTYLNPGTAQSDYDNNKVLYDNAMSSRTAAATCSEKTAEFKISVKYDAKTGDTIQTKTINFPYETSPEGQKLNQGTTNKESVISNQNSVLIDFAGCYENKEATKDYYMAEWTFPGTYIHNKTGAVSYTKPSAPEGWAYEDKRFCMPLNALSVNPKWWEWKTMDNSCYGPAEIQAELNSTDGANGYNISAQAENFGYFGWNFDIGCFYAIRNEVCIPEDKCCKKTTCTPGDPECSECTPGDPDCPDEIKTSAYNYTFRTVDIDNMFPNAEENPTVGSDKREIGFNWTSKASGTNKVGTSYYNINPSQLINDIQNNASTLYSVDNKDYEFYLTPEDLKTIRKYNKNKESGAGKGYSEWGGSTYERNGVNTYFSNLFRPEGEGQILTRSGVIKQTGEPGKNNQ